jgi:uncharacterized protein (TIGR00725 family)
VKDGSGPRRHELQGGSVEGHSRPSERAPQIAVIGSSRTEPGSEAWALAEEIGRLLAEAGARVVCGGGPGVMEAVALGASEASGTVIGILPGVDPREANPYCTQAIATGIGQARNLAVVASGEATIAVGGEWGTLSEIAYARYLGRTVVALRSWSLSGRGEMEEAPGVAAVETPEEAVAAALEAIAA